MLQNKKGLRYKKDNRVKMNNKVNPTSSERYFTTAVVSSFRKS